MIELDLLRGPDPRGFCPNGRNMRLYKGGGGGSSEKNYENLNRLYGVQADSASMLYEQANQYLPGATSAYTSAAQEFLDPAYAERQAARAKSDMVSANAMERAATERELSSMGVNPNDPRFASSMRQAETTNAARMAAGQNLARDQAKQKSLAVSQDVVGTFTGQSNSAAQQMKEANKGLASLYESKNQQQAANDTQTANAWGNLAGAGLMAYDMRNSFKDGGKVCSRFGYGGVRRYADGGRVRALEKHGMGGFAGNGGFLSFSTPMPPPSYTSPAPQGSPVMAGLQGAMRMRQLGNAYNGIKTGSMAANITEGIGKLAGKFSEEAGNQIQSHAAGMRMAGDQAQAAEQAYRTAAEQSTDAAARQAYTTAADNIVSGAGLQAAGSTAGATAAEGLATTAPGVASTVGQMASGLGAAGAAGAGGAATSTALGSAMGTVSTALPWIGAAYAVGSLLGAWADGGKIESPTQDLRDGSKVEGPGGPTDDLIPALLSNGEYVLPAESVKLIGEGRLNTLKERGLALRRRGTPLGKIKPHFGIRHLRQAAG